MTPQTCNRCLVHSLSLMSCPQTPLSGDARAREGWGEGKPLSGDAYRSVLPTSAPAAT